MKELIINQNDAGQRLDKFLTKYMPSLPQSMLYKSLRKNCVKINGKHIKDGSYILKSGDEMKLYMKDEFFKRKKNNASSYALPHPDIVYEDKNIIIADKPEGLVVHTDEEENRDTLINRIKSYLYQKGEYNPEFEHSFAPSLCNRLDKNTCGLIIAAKNALALRIINEKIRLREIKKFYMCAVEGNPPQSGIAEGYLKRNDKYVSITDSPENGAKPIKTKYRVIKRYENHSILEIELLTGRTHQIRAHMAHLGYPLLGDIKYGAKKIPNTYQQLQSFKLKFDFKTDAGELNYLNGKEFISNLKKIREICC